MSPLAESIKKTLAYFDIFDYPLTKEELFAYLWRPPRMAYEEFIAGNFDSAQEKFGYYFLPGREEISENRRRRLLISEMKMKIARKAVKKIRSVPFLKAVFVCNSVGAGLAQSGSDIDFFIIAAPGRIWLVRFFTNLILKFWRLRTYGKNSRDKICLSFYVDDAYLDLRPLCAGNEDIHFIYWLHQMIPVFDPQNYYEKFLAANRWTEDFLPNVKRISSSAYLLKVSESGPSHAWKRAWETMWRGVYGNLIEKQAKELQTQRLKSGIKAAAARGDNSVVISDAVIKLHENDARRKYYEKWKKK